MSAHADRNLLFGILAVQLDFVSRDALIAGMNAWLLDKSKPLGEILRDQGHLSPERLQLLTALVAEHLKQHDGDAEKSLTAVSSLDPWLRRQLASVDDADVQQSIGHVRSARPAEPTIDEPPESRLRYRILRPHARGALGEVFVAEDTELGRSVALKEIQSQRADDPDSRSRFVREAEITGSLEHPGVVPVYGLGTYDDGRPFYAMRFIKGDNLKAAIKQFHGDGHDAGERRGVSPPVTAKTGGLTPRRSPAFDSLEFRQLLRRFIDVCNAVAYAHSRGVLHRDLKPGNIMLGKYGETLVVDWGLAKVWASRERERPEDAESTIKACSGGESSGTVMGQALGTPAYMSPEQAAGKLDELGPATDVYSLRATLYELLTGRPPFTEPDLDAVQKGDFPQPRFVNPLVPQALEAVCCKSMASKPADRYRSALDLAREVEHWLADEPVTAWREPWSLRAWRWVRHHRTMTTTAAVVLLALAAGFGLLAIEKEKARKAVADERDEKEQARKDADEARTDSLKGNFLLTDILHALATNPGEWHDEDRVRLREVVAHYEKAALKGDRTDRFLAAAVRGRLGQVQKQLGDRRDAEESFRYVMQTNAQLATEYPEYLHYRIAVSGGHFALAHLLLENGRLEEGESSMHTALVIAEKNAPLGVPYFMGITYYHAASRCSLGSAGATANPSLSHSLAARAVKMLRQAVAKGYDDIPHLLADPDLAPLRRRDDYAALLWDLADLPAAPPPKP